MDRIPMADLQREYLALRPEIDAAVGRVLARGWFVLGEEDEAFETAWAAYCGAAHAIGVGNGTDAIELILRAVGIGQGDEVIVPALTAVFTALAVSATGATPVPADIDPRRYTLDPAAFEAAITPRTAAVIPVHLYGCPADMAPILEIARRHHLFVLEDAAQAHGARYKGVRVGSLADAAAFSFYPSKNLGAYGDAGAVVTDDVNLAERVRMLRHGGQRLTYQHEIVGTNSRLDEIQAAILQVKLGHLDTWNERRRAIARRYTDGLSNVSGVQADSQDASDLSDLPALWLPVSPAGVEHVYHLFVVRATRRDALRTFLEQSGIATGVHYPRAVHEQAAYAHLGYEAWACPNAPILAREVLSLPIFPQMRDKEIDRVVDALQTFLEWDGHIDHAWQG